MLNLGQNQRILALCELDIWQMILKNNRAPLLCYFKLCVSFHSYWSIQPGVTVRKHPIRVKIDNFLSRATLKFNRWPWKTLGHLCYATLSFVCHFIAIGELKLELRSGNAKIGTKFVLTPVTLTFHMDIIFVNGNNSPQFHDLMTGTL